MLVALIVLALATAGTALAVRSVAVSWQPLIVLAAFAHYALWAAYAAVVAALLAHLRVLAVIAAALAAVTLLVQVPALVDRQRPADGPRIVVVQANLRVGNADPAALVRLVRERHVDVLATEELTDAEQARLIAAGLTRALPHRFTAPLPGGGGGLGMWSRYPIRARHNLPRYRLGVLTAQLQVPGAKSVHLAAVHLLPPYPYPFTTWQHEIAAVRSVMQAGRGPAVIAGDFNATVDNAQLRRLLDHGFDDAAEASGSGYLPTYPTDRWLPPVLGLDHVLVRSLTADGVRTLTLPGSDHRAVLALLRLPHA